MLKNAFGKIKQTQELRNDYTLKKMFSAKRIEDLKVEKERNQKQNNKIALKQVNLELKKTQ